MNSLELLASLREQAESIPITDEVRPTPDCLPIKFETGSIEYVSDCMSRYNYEAYLEITDPETVVVVADIDNDAVIEFESILDGYMETYAPNRPNLTMYIKLVSLYLAFVARRPLHPPGIMAPNPSRGITCKITHSSVAGKEDLDERFPICRYCVSYSNIKPMK